jgi:hypothetical protein
VNLAARAVGRESGAKAEALWLRSGVELQRGEGRGYRYWCVADGAPAEDATLARKGRPPRATRTEQERGAAMEYLEGRAKMGAALAADAAADGTGGYREMKLEAGCVGCEVWDGRRLSMRVIRGRQWNI